MENQESPTQRENQQKETSNQIGLRMQNKDFLQIEHQKSHQYTLPENKHQNSNVKPRLYLTLLPLM